PFLADAPLSIVVSIHPGREAVRGRIEMRSAEGRRLGARELSGPSCVELTPALALALAVARDPLRARTGPASAAPAPAVAAASSQPAATTAAAAPSAPGASAPGASAPPPVEPRVRPPRPRLLDALRLRVAFGVQAAMDVAPGPTFGFMGRVAVAAGRWSLAVELRGDLPGSAEVEGGRVSASTMAAFLAPCVLHRLVAFCALGGAGGQEVAGTGFLSSRSSWVPWAALGGRVELTLAVNPLVAALLRVDVLFPVTRTELFVRSERPQLVYRTSMISSTFWLALATRRP